MSPINRRTVTGQFWLVALVGLLAGVAINVMGQQQQQQQQQSQEPQQSLVQIVADRDSKYLEMLRDPKMADNIVEQHSHSEANQGPGNKDLWPLVNIDKQANKSKVDVHVPVFFDMTNQNDPDSGRQKLDLSVMQGLVTVSKDKTRDQDGRLTGPVKVTVFGIPVYSTKGTAASGSGEQVERVLTRGQNEIETKVASTRSLLAERAGNIQEQARSNFQKGNEKLVSSLSDILDKLSTVLKQSTSVRGQQQPQQLQQQQLQQSPSVSSDVSLPVGRASYSRAFQAESASQ